MVKVTVAGAAGGIGQPLSLLLKLNTNVTELALFDIVNAKGVAADLSHINTPAVVTGYQPKDKEDKTAIVEALKGTDVVIIPAGVPRKPGMTRADLFNINASIIRDLVANIGRTAPNAAILIISNPVNSTVPIAAQVLKRLGVFNPKKLFGVTTLDSVRAETFFGELTNTNPNTLKGKISVIGGHSGDTIVPLINYNKSVGLISSKSQYDAFVHRVQFGGDEVVKAKNGAGSATLSMAYAGYRFAEYVINSLSGRSKNEPVPDSAYIYLPGIPGGKEVSNAHLQGVEFFSVPVFLSNGEISSFIDPFKSLTVTDDEKKLVEVALKGLKGSIDQGVQFVDASKL
ncbi:Mdh1-3 predicted malate dehydrogenase [Candida orthopsilosis Co 90-125]|uniref:Malate dehydrogenase n=1 Tax=Candida orthopsilosis (strain 90-125) TaxID=1136231 RepID=H8X3W1_CANO9|nr:Mdh1-3 predicted malate dehydrogenase [Candida orthopsilosis Co 90-125]CCG25749.1 Mdh1-3 predicted malate dehydrogenase [Candida orthopsilosis Co 90-125]